MKYFIALFCSPISGVFAQIWWICTRGAGGHETTVCSGWAAVYHWRIAVFRHRVRLRLDLRTLISSTLKNILPALILWCFPCNASSAQPLYHLAHVSHCSSQHASSDMLDQQFRGNLIWMSKLRCLFISLLMLQILNARMLLTHIYSYG